MRLEILRRKNKEAEPYIQTIEYEPADNTEAVSTALSRINRGGYTDTEGREVTMIMWEHSCHQKKCGACAMVINGRPRLACGARLCEFEKTGRIRLEPLKKFPVIADLCVDRSVMADNLIAIKAWLERDIVPDERSVDIAYEASRCLQCGCCLEVCPNFYAGGEFFSMAAAVPAARLIAQLDKKDAADIRKAYSRRVFAGCGKSLSCKSVCPAGIETDRLLVNSNALAVWGRLLRKKK